MTLRGAVARRREEPVTRQDHSPDDARHAAERHPAIEPQFGGVSKDTVQRVWRDNGLQPHHPGFKGSNNPRFTEKLVDIVGLYLNPTELDLHLIVDNSATHKPPKVVLWLKRHPRFHQHPCPWFASSRSFVAAKPSGSKAWPATVAERSTTFSLAIRFHLGTLERSRFWSGVELVLFAFRPPMLRAATRPSIRRFTAALHAICVLVGPGLHLWQAGSCGCGYAVPPAPQSVCDHGACCHHGHAASESGSEEAPDSPTPAPAHDPDDCPVCQQLALARIAALYVRLTLVAFDAPLVVPTRAPHEPLLIVADDFCRGPPVSAADV